MRPILLVSLVNAAAILCSGEVNRPKLCDAMTTVVLPGAKYRSSNDNLRRVDVRRCAPGVAEGIQLVAWEDGSKVPAITFETAGGDVLQMAVGQNVFALEVSGGSRNHVYVITHDAGKPKMAVKQATKARANMTLDSNGLRIEIPNSGSNSVDRYSFPPK